MPYTFRDKTVTPTGHQPNIGEYFSDFNLVDKNNNSIHSNELKGNSTLISVVPDINTKVCSLQTKHFNEEVDSYKKIDFITISTNSVEEQKNWCAAENVLNMKLISDANHDFGANNGLYIEEFNIDLRSVWITDSSGKIIYKQVLENQHVEPDYDSALTQLKQL